MRFSDKIVLAGLALVGLGLMMGGTLTWLIVDELRTRWRAWRRRRGFKLMARGLAKTVGPPRPWFRL